MVGQAAKMVCPPKKGQEIRVFWVGDQRWFGGVIRDYDPVSERHLIVYDDGEQQHENLSDASLKWEPIDSTPRDTATPCNRHVLPLAKRRTVAKRKMQDVTHVPTPAQLPLQGSRLAVRTPVAVGHARDASKVASSAATPVYPRVVLKLNPQPPRQSAHSARVQSAASKPKAPSKLPSTASLPKIWPGATRIS